MNHRDIVYLGTRLMMDLTGRFARQAVKMTDDGLIHVVLDAKTNKLYKILITETTIEKELPRLKLNVVPISPLDVHYVGIGAVACRDWPEGIEFSASLYLSEVTCTKCRELFNASLGKDQVPEIPNTSRK